MTAARGGPGEETELDGYGDVISRMRAGISELTTEELVRIRALLEAGLDAGQGPGSEAGVPDRAALEAMLRALADDA